MFSETLKQTRKMLKLTQAKLAEMVGIDTSSIAKYETGNATPSLDIIIKISDILHVSLDTLLNRNTDTIDVESVKLVNLYQQAPSYLKKIAVLSLSQGKCESLTATVEIYTIDYYADYPVSAGVGNFIDETRKTMLTLKKSPPHGACFVNRIVGDSMEPTYSNDDMIFVSPDPAAQGDIGIFIYENEVYIKQLGDHELISLNIKYKPIKITVMDSFFCIGTVIGKCDNSYFDDNKQP